MPAHRGRRIRPAGGADRNRVGGAGDYRTEGAICSVPRGGQASLFKIKGTEIQQRLTELALEAVGNYALVNRPTVGHEDNRAIPGPEYSQIVTEEYLNARKKSIYGGSNEIQRNIIAKTILDL